MGISYLRERLIKAFIKKTIAMTALPPAFLHRVKYNKNNLLRRKNKFPHLNQKLIETTTTNYELYRKHSLYTSA